MNSWTLLPGSGKKYLGDLFCLNINGASFFFELVITCIVIYMFYGAIISLAVWAQATLISALEPSLSWKKVLTARSRSGLRPDTLFYDLAWIFTTLFFRSKTFSCYTKRKKNGSSERDRAKGSLPKYTRPFRNLPILILMKPSWRVLNDCCEGRKWFRRNSGSASRANGIRMWLVSP